MSEVQNGSIEDTGIELRYKLEREGGLTFLREEHGLTPTQLYCLNVLLSHRNADGGTTFPSARRLAWETGMHLSTVMSAITGLADAGLIEYQKEKGRSNQYYFPKFVTSLAQAGHPDGDYKQYWRKRNEQRKRNEHKCTVSRDTSVPSNGTLVSRLTEHGVPSNGTEGKEKEKIKENNKEKITQKSPETSQPGTPTATPDGVIRESGEGGRLPFMDRGQWIDELRAVNTCDRKQTIRLAIQDHGGHINGESIPHTVDAGVAFLENAFDQIGLVL